MKDSDKLTASWVVDTAKIGGIVASACAALFLYGFAFSAKVNILAFVTLTDFLRVAIQCVVPVVIAQIIGYYISIGFNFVSTHIDNCHGLSETENKKRKKQDIVLDFIYIISVIVILVYEILNGELIFAYSTGTIVSVLIWGKGIWVCSNYTRLMDKCDLNMVSLLYIVPVAFMMSFGCGLVYGVEPKEIKKPCALTLDNNEQLYGEVLFSLDKFVVVRQIGHKDITFLPPERVISINSPISLSTPSTSNWGRPQQK